MSQSVTCSSCGNTFNIKYASKYRIHPYFCKRTECQSQYSLLRAFGGDKEKHKEYQRRWLDSQYPEPAQERRADKVTYKKPEKYAPVEFDALGRAVEPNIYRRLVDGNGRWCSSCPYIDNCRQRTWLGLFVLCESASKREIEIIERDPEMRYNLELLSVEFFEKASVCDASI